MSAESRGKCEFSLRCPKPWGGHQKNESLGSERELAMKGAQVTAVVTTTGRPTLRRAVLSALRQNVAVEVLVILYNAEAKQAVHRRLDGLKCRVVVADELCSSAAARNLGCRLAETPYVAFLDERDEWLGDKVRAQLLEAGENVVMSSRALLVSTTSRIVPEHVYRTGGAAHSWAEHLFEDGRIPDEHLYSQTSTLLCSRQAVLAVPWAEDLPRHADWDWLIRLEAADYQIFQHSDVLVRVFQESRQNKLRPAEWQASQKWATSLEALMSPELVGNFRASVVARGAFSAKAWAPGCQALISSIRAGADRSAVIWGVSGLMSRG